MYELSLFTGGGGGVLASQHLLGWQTVGYVEIDPYCQQVIMQRIADGVLHDAPIFGDIREFIASGCAERYRGMVDVISAGFPCPSFSVAGKRRGENDSRNMWPATIECIRQIRPRFFFGENVPNLLTFRYFGRILGDLAESGYDVQWRCLSAAEVGAPHKRDRLWIVAHSRHAEPSGRDETAQGSEGQSCREFASQGYVVADADSARRNQRNTKLRTIPKPNEESPQLADPDISGPQGRDERSQCSCELTPWTCCIAHENDRLARSGIRRVSNGVAKRVDRLKSLGNGQVPLVAATAWRLLSEGLIDEHT